MWGYDRAGVVSEHNTETDLNLAYKHGTTDHGWTILVDVFYHVAY